MRTLAAVAVAGSGCAQLLGIDDTTGGTDAPAPGAHITIQRVSVGATVVTAPLDAMQTMDKVTFLVPDGAGGFTKVPGTASAAAGQWQADIPTGNPVLDFTTLGNRHIWAFPSRDVHVAAVQMEHPNAQPPPANAQLVMNVDIGGYDGTTSYYLEAVGAWSYHPFAAAELPGLGGNTISATLDYSMFDRLASPPITKITAADQVVLLRYSGSQLTGAFQTQFEQADTNTLTGTLADVTIDKTVNAGVNLGAVATRFTAVRPGVSTLGAYWSVNAAPGYAKGAVAGLQLNQAGLAMTDTSFSAMYGNPFASLGWKELMIYQASESRTVTLPGGEMLSLGAYLTTIADPAQGATLDLPAGLPETISIEMMPLTTDNMTIMLDPAKYVHVTILADKPQNTLYAAGLYEVMPSSMGVSLKLVVDAITNDPQSLVLPPDAFQAGHTYTIQAACYQGGYSSVASGDLTVAAPPFNSASAFSGVFTVQNP